MSMNEVPEVGCGGLLMRGMMVCCWRLGGISFWRFRGLQLYEISLQDWIASMYSKGHELMSTVGIELSRNQEDGETFPQNPPSRLPKATWLSFTDP
jgi:hypothetical protein